VGRWTTKDPILFDGSSTGLYTYVDNEPVNYVDSSGLVECNWVTCKVYRSKFNEAGLKYGLPPQKGNPKKVFSDKTLDAFIKEITEKEIDKLKIKKMKPSLKLNILKGVAERVIKNKEISDKKIKDELKGCLERMNKKKK